MEMTKATGEMVKSEEMFKASEVNKTKEMLKSAEHLKDKLIKTRREFHMYPEISGCEAETSKKVASYLNKLGFKVTEGVGGYGVVAEMKGNKPGKTVALRADMDALQIQEMNEVPYKSKHDGVMHACGHDNHMTILLGAAELIAGHMKQGEVQGTVRLIFQPSEEKSPVGGSRKMIAEGALDDVDAVFGLHVWPDIPQGKIGVKSGAVMAASDHFTVTIHGKSSHAARPDEGIDALLLGAQFVQAVQNIVSREVNPASPAVVTIGRMEAGTRYNIVAETCTLEGTCRTLNEDVRDHIEKQLKQVLDGICLMHGASGELNYERGYMAVINDEEMVLTARETVAELFGGKAVASVSEPSMCGEDFAFYLKEKPGALIWLGTGREPENTFPLHNSKFDVDEEILWKGAALMAQIAFDFLGKF